MEGNSRDVANREMKCIISVLLSFRTKKLDDIHVLTSLIQLSIFSIVFCWVLTLRLMQSWGSSAYFMQKSPYLVIMLSRGAVYKITHMGPHRDPGSYQSQLIQAVISRCRQEHVDSCYEDMMRTSWHGCLKWLFIDFFSKMSHFISQKSWKLVANNQIY